METRPLDRDIVHGEALFILKSLKENGRLGRSNKLAEVKAVLEPSVSLDFDDYFFFLRKFQYVAMDREAQLKLTEQGEKIVEGANLDRFSEEVGEYFADKLAPDAAADEEDDATQPRAAPTVELSNSLLTAVSNLPPPPPPAEEPRMTQRKPLPQVEPVVAPVPVQSFHAPPAASAVAASGPSPQGFARFDPLGSGPLGTVFKGKHQSLGIDVCIKELKDIFGYFSFLQRNDVLKRLKKELCAQAQVRHPAVVQVIEQAVESARPHFVVELLQSSLRARLDQAGGKPLPVAETVRHFLQLAYGLRAAHAQGLLHHNLKPENVLFDPNGNAKLADFGLGRVIEVEAGKGLPQVFVGTGGMAYLAPELIGRKEAAAAADVYGLGIILYEMLTGRVPGRRSPVPSEANPEVPSKLDPIFDKMTHDKPSERYPSMDALLDDFYAAFSEGEYGQRGELVLAS